MIVVIVTLMVTLMVIVVFHLRRHDLTVCVLLDILYVILTSHCRAFEDMKSIYCVSRYSKYQNNIKMLCNKVT
jgi:hypothetical protein